MKRHERWTGADAERMGAPGPDWIVEADLDELPLYVSARHRRAWPMPLRHAKTISVPTRIRMEWAEQRSRRGRRAGDYSTWSYDTALPQIDKAVTALRDKGLPVSASAVHRELQLAMKRPPNIKTVQDWARRGWIKLD